MVLNHFLDKRDCLDRIFCLIVLKKVISVNHLLIIKKNENGESKGTWKRNKNLIPKELISSTPDPAFLNGFLTM